MSEDLLRAGELLRDLYAKAATTALEAVSGEARRITALYAKSPDDPTAAVGMTLLALARLSAHVDHDLGEPFLTIAGEHERLAEPDDEQARVLAAEVIARASRAREIDPADNLPVFALGLAHELRGEHDDAVAAYREATRIDPNDHPAVTRLETLTDEEFEGPDEDPPCTHAGAFYLLDLIAPEDDDGRQERRVLLSTDATEVRAAADEYFASRKLTHDALDYTVGTHVPGAESEMDFLLTTLIDDAPVDHPVIDWREVEMPPLEGPRLAPGRAIRENGELHFFGWTVSQEA